MKNFAFAVTVLCGLFTITLTDLNACGEKMVAMGAGARYSLFPPTVVLFRKDPVLQAAIKHAGFDLHVAGTSNDVAHLLKSRKVAAVVYDPSDAAAIESIVKAAPSKPVMIQLEMLAPKSTESKYRETINKAVKQGRV